MVTNRCINEAKILLISTYILEQSAGGQYQADNLFSKKKRQVRHHTPIISLFGPAVDYPTAGLRLWRISHVHTAL